MARSEGADRECLSVRDNIQGVCGNWLVDRDTEQGWQRLNVREDCEDAISLF